MSNITSLGRVVPLYKGSYNASTVYNKLDVVFYEETGSSYISIIDLNSGHTPANNPSYWQLIASQGGRGPQGVSGGFGSTTASANAVAYTSNPAVTVTTDPLSPNTAKNFHFDFQIPAGRVGFDSVSATATAGVAGGDPSVGVSLDTSDVNDHKLQFEFVIPGAEGSAVTSVDGIAPTGTNVQLCAVQYRANQNLSPEQKVNALTNIGAQAAGDYISSPQQYADGNVLKYSSTDSAWVAGTVNEVPSSGTNGYFLTATSNGAEWAAVRQVPGESGSTYGKYLQSTSSGMTWNYTLPAAGIINAPLIKNSNNDQDIKWGSIITTTEIDTMMGISNS